MKLSEERRVNLKLQDDLHVRIKVAAARGHTTMQALISQWLKERLDQDEQEALSPVAGDAKPP